GPFRPEAAVTGATMTMIRDRARTTADLLKHMDIQRLRAARAAGAAVRHEALAGFDGALRELHERHAAMQRRIERLHLASLDLYQSLLARMKLPEQAASAGGPPSLLWVAARIAGSTGAILALVDACGTATVCLASDPTAVRAYEVELEAGE